MANIPSKLNVLIDMLEAPVGISAGNLAVGISSETDAEGNAVYRVTPSNGVAPQDFTRIGQAWHHALNMLVRERIKRSFD